VRPLKTHCLHGHERTPDNLNACGACMACNRTRTRAASKKRQENPEALREFNEKRYVYNKLRPKHVMVEKAKVRAKKRNLPCTITVDDFEIPEFCPVLGVPLLTSATRTHPNSPSLDRFHPAMGYVPGNVVVISHRANRLKGDGILEEHKRLVSWMESWPAQREVEAVEGGGTSYKVLPRW